MSMRRGKEASSSTNYPKNMGYLKSCSMSSTSNTNNYKRNPGPRIKRHICEDDYESPKRFCHCGLPAPRWTSWTNWNPGRRFFGCRYYDQEEHCDFFDWYDAKFEQRPLKVIRLLLDETEMMHGDCDDYGCDDGRSFLEEVDAIHGEIRKLRKSHELNEKKATRSELKFNIAVGILLLTWVFVFVPYLGKP